MMRVALLPAFVLLLTYPSAVTSVSTSLTIASPRPFPYRPRCSSCHLCALTKPEITNALPTAKFAKAPWTTTITDTAIGAFGAGFGFWSLSYLESITGIPFYAGSFASSAMIIFSGFKPPPAKNVFLGTFGGTAAAVAVLMLLGDGELARATTVGACLIYFKVTGALFPPGAALATVIYDNEARQSLGWSYVLCPALSGNVVLYLIAMGLAPLRKQARISLELDVLRIAEEGLDREALKEMFYRFDASGDGAIDAEELKVLFKLGVGVDVTDEDCEAIVVALDTDGDRTISFEEARSYASG